MSKRDVGYLTLGRFLVVERYCQSSQPSSTHPAQSPRPDRTGSHPNKPDASSGSRAPARPHHG
jgi:hypothetical protein